jgi:hypothetical protein
MLVKLKNTTDSIITINTISIEGNEEITLYNNTPEINQIGVYYLLYNSSTFSTKLMAGDLIFIKDSVNITNENEINTVKDFIMREFERITYNYTIT